MALRRCPFCHDASSLIPTLIEWWFKNHTRSQHAALHESVAAELAQLAVRKPGGLWFINHRRRFLSYPTGMGDRQHNPRVDWLASAARAARIQLRVVVLHRDAVALEASDDRRFHEVYLKKWGDVDAAHPVAAAMRVQAVALREQLSTLAREQVACVEYEGLPQAADAADRLLCRPLAGEACVVDRALCPRPLGAGAACPRDWSFAKGAADAFRPPTNASHGRAADGVGGAYLAPLREANARLLKACRAGSAVE